MTQLGKLWMLAGLLALLAGAVLWLLGRSGLRGLPGDLRYEGRNVTILVPIATCVVASVVLTLAVWLVRWIGRR